MILSSFPTPTILGFYEVKSIGLQQSAPQGFVLRHLLDEAASPRGKASPKCENTQLLLRPQAPSPGFKGRTRGWLQRGWEVSSASPHAEQPQHHVPQVLAKQQPRFEYQWESESAVNVTSKGSELPAPELSPLAQAPRSQQSQRHSNFKTKHHFFLPNTPFECLSERSPRVTAVAGGGFAWCFPPPASGGARA